ncbi:hypothetical protein CU044_0751 [Streptomyces sp. L-9-10]|uniref:DUF6879 family protein n=1 Tax=Streptomyces sp. L-9-10 TaxID=1478131 RepID=UPI00101D9875|nr:DUF6879 family protein [Streptomyces sp. L-9-10]RYJ31108.1 hypothetical protein CU044_0751 [Streptomyces sp. L-9-10]
MLSALADATGDRLELDAYLEDFDQHFWRAGRAGFWKLERQQTFREPGVKSWEAFFRGEWGTALSLISEQRGHYERYFRKIADHGFGLHRVRVVEEPISPYLQWELHLLRLKEQCGEDTRVVGLDDIALLEPDGALPEIAIIGSSVLYEIVYDGEGNLAGGIRYTDSGAIAECRRIIRDLHGSGERLDSFFGRRVASLPAPAMHHLRA